VIARAEPARRLEYVLDDGLRPSSELDEARRRVKRNVQEIEHQLRLGGHRGEAVPTEAILTEMTRRLQSMAAYERTICRSGQFDEVDLAIYLKQSANFLCRPRGRSPEPEWGSAGGWVFANAGASLSWTRGSSDADRPEPEGLNLSDALRFLAPRWQETARRAVCACAVLFPPGPFNWRSWFGMDPAHQQARPGDLGIRLRPTANALLVEVWVADRSLGLPRYLEPEGKVALEGQLAGRLQGQAGESLPDPSSAARFEVAIVSAPPAAKEVVGCGQSPLEPRLNRSFAA
jgi:hypothetical protein